LPDQELKKQLNNWIQLSLNREIPPTLLILAATFSYAEYDQQE